MIQSFPIGLPSACDGKWRTPMTEFTKGTSVFVHLTDGDSFLDEYVKDTAEFHVFKKAGRVKKDSILRMGLDRIAKEPEAEK